MIDNNDAGGAIDIITYLLDTGDLARIETPCSPDFTATNQCAHHPVSRSFIHLPPSFGHNQGHPDEKGRWIKQDKRGLARDKGE